jgi:hypothetical protein
MKGVSVTEVVGRASLLFVVRQQKMAPPKFEDPACDQRRTANN